MIVFIKRLGGIQIPQTEEEKLGEERCHWIYAGQGATFISGKNHQTEVCVQWTLSMLDDIHSSPF